MTQIDWSLQDPNAYQRGYQQTKGVFDDLAATRKQNALDGALRQYATNPDDPGAVNALAQVDPRLAIQVREQQAQSARRQQTDHLAQLEHHRDNIIKGAQIVRQIQPKDQAGWDQTLATARHLGIDVSELPSNWNDPATQQFAQGLIAAADAFEPQKPESSPYQVVPGQPGAGVYRFDKRDGTMSTLVQANDGSGVAGAPAAPSAAGSIPQVSDEASYNAIPPGQQYRTPDGHIRVKAGGQTQPASGGFP